jgi:hypothetical protein
VGEGVTNQSKEGEEAVRSYRQTNGKCNPCKATTHRHKAWKGNHNRAEGLEHHKYRVALSKDYGQEDSYVI